MVSRIVLLDAGPLGLVSNPKPSRQNLACSAWLQGLLDAGLTRVLEQSLLEGRIGCHWRLL